MRETLIPVDDGECVVAKGIITFWHDPTSAGAQQVPTGCVPDTVSGGLTDVEIVAIVAFKAAFEGSIEEARQALSESR